MKKSLLQKLYTEDRLSTHKIGEITNTSSGNVYYFLKKYNIPTRKAKRVIINREELKSLYLDKKMSLLDIAKLKNCAFQTIGEKLIEFGIERRPYGTKGLSFPGRKLSAEHKEKIRKFRTGRKEKPEFGKKISESLKKTYGKKYKKGYVGSVNSGYQMIKHNGKMEYVHRVVAEEKLGRKLKKGEVVHHIDLDKNNNKHSNLIVLPSQAAHVKLHANLDRIIKIMLEKKLVYFKNGSYFAK